MCQVRNCRSADLNTGIITNQSFSFDAASNVLADDCIYDVNNRLTSFKENSITYDADGNMTDAFLNEQNVNFVFDSRNRLISDGTHTYTYNAENTRIRSVCNNVETHYTYNTNASLSQLLVKRTGGNITKYVYGLGLIGEESQGSFKTYHFDYRGSTVAITDDAGVITDTFAYDTYGKLINRTGETNTPFLYNGRDGVMTEENGLYYMRARYYSPELKRFINADVVSGKIANSPTLNRYAYANGNPVSNVDPFGLSPDRTMVDLQQTNRDLENWLQKALDNLSKLSSYSFGAKTILYNDATTSITYLSHITSGSGNFEIQQTFANQLETLSSFTFPTEVSGLDIKFQSNGELSFEYTVPIDNYNEITIKLSSKLSEMSYSYLIQTMDDMNNELSTELAVTYRTPPEELSKPSVGEVSLEWLETAAWALLVTGALIETGVTLGAGIWNDGIAIGGFLTQFSQAVSTTAHAVG